jgi:multiple antibiotic resistance protein
MPAEFLISAVVTLLVVVDPIGLVPTFIAMTDGLPMKARRQVAFRACAIAALILMGCALIGDWFLKHLGIGLPAFRIAGGLLLFSIASEMVFGVRIERQARTAEQAIEERVRNIAAFPLGIPLLAGPAAITATILLAARSEGHARQLFALLGVIAGVALVSFLIFSIAARIEKFLGITGNIVLSRLLGVVLAALAVQFVLDGLRGFGLVAGGAPVAGFTL